jgi:HEAT repeat protein
VSTQAPGGGLPPGSDLEDWLYAAIAAGGPGLLDTLITYAGHNDPEIRSTAAYGLGEIEDDRAIDPLIRLADLDEDEKVRDEALRALDSYRDPRILDCLVREVARVKRSRPPRQVVARQLRHYRSERAVVALTELLDDPDEFVRSDAAESLEKVLAEL